jgi:hypothetical protein
MKTHRNNTTLFITLLLVVGLVCTAAITHRPAIALSQKSSAQTTDVGYSVLKLFLADEQYLTAIRRVKMVITFEGISKDSSALIDKIADSSELALEQLEKLAMVKPAIVLKDFSDDSIAKATLDSLRMATAKEFLFETDDFEKNLLLSQSQILRVISHLAKQLEEKETNTKRKDWLNNLARHYESYYQQVYALIAITTNDKA